jgi:hypothetical protein
MRLVVLSLSVLPVASAIAQAPSFAPPVRLKAGDEFLGNKNADNKGERLFPSPVFHDLDGDGLADLVVGDLRGHLTVARRLPGTPGTPATFAKEEKVLGADGKIVDLHNW